ncbi:hypothetical protein ALC60_07294 [Trachymyrmex zeteki]|uniref:Uncharacterized protein n=1 Tax=Mycetomoellerius zeteki TaxID=64791 RepID=A0A151X0D7_9HYME|nr:hypothetical protein ALC60_07294 [Trachymyrmex zeteki]
MEEEHFVESYDSKIEGWKCFLDNFYSIIHNKAHMSMNNNSNVLQIKSAYKRLLIRHKIKQFNASNCLSDSFEILHASFNQKKIKCPLINEEIENFDKDILTFDHDYMKTM